MSTLSKRSHEAGDVIALSPEQLKAICTSGRWQRAMQLKGPFADYASMKYAADQAFCELAEDDWLEAFLGHPMIGDLETLQNKYAQGKTLSQAEQSGVKGASQDVLQSLLEYNQRYLEKFGFIFIVCATNKSAAEMLGLIQSRINNPRSVELLNASTEQRKISHIRMEAYR